jgi:hypothetical protein
MNIKIIDPFTNIELKQVVTADPNADAVFLSDLRSINVGDGGVNTFRADKQGMWLGGEKFATANFSVSMAGVVTASMFVVVGGTIRYGKTSFTDSVNDGYYFGTEGLYAGKASDATIFKFKISDGSLQYGGKVIAGAGSDVNATYITGAITASQISSVYASTISGNISASQITSITAGQITGQLSAGQISSVNANTISGTIVSTQIGSINAATITIGSIQNSQIGSVSASKLTAGTIDCSVITVTNINASNITSGIITSRVIRSAASGNRIEMLNNSFGDDKVIYWVSSGGIAMGYLQYDFSTNKMIMFGANISLLSQGNIVCQGYTIPSISNYFDLGSTSYYWNTGYVNQITGSQGTIYFNQGGRVQVSTHFDPGNAGSFNLGGSSRYWNDISYKTLTDRGCLGWFDEGVELQDGKIVSDLEALENIKKHPTLKTIYGTPRLDYKTMPKVTYKIATDHEGKILDRDKNDKPFYMEGKKKLYAQDGAEMSSLISIMLGAIKELNKEVKSLKNK